MKLIKVEPWQLDACASHMEANRIVYENHINELYSMVDALQASWHGKDNVAFTTEIQKYEGTLRSMAVLCAQYGDFLKNSAAAYRSTQDELVSCAARLVK